MKFLEFNQFSRPPAPRETNAPRSRSSEFENKIDNRKSLLPKNKRAFLLASETLKIVIAVICIGFLIYFLSALYFNNTNAKKLVHAKSILTDSDENIESIVDKIRLHQGSLQEGNAEEFEFVNPVGWSLFSFIVGTSEYIPNSCGGVSCLCVCDGVFVDKWGNQAKECSNEGVCLIVPELEYFEEIEIQDGVNKILISNVEGGIYVNGL